MTNLLISTLPIESGHTEQLQTELRGIGCETELILTSDMKISHCIGCNHCWIKTPGICRIKDDYEEILKKLLAADRAIFLTEAKLGFVSSKMKNLVDRMLPLATMHLKFKNGQMRHYSRYGRQPDLGLVALDCTDEAYLELWLERVQLNLHGKCLGAYDFRNRKGLYHALGHR